jgi:hypothetical protein
MFRFLSQWLRPSAIRTRTTRPHPRRSFRRPTLEFLEERMAPANVFLVPTTVAADSTHFYTLASALTAAGASGSVTIEPGASPDPGTVSVTQNVLIKGDAMVSPTLLPLENLNVMANGVMLQHLNLGTVTIGAGFSGAVITDSVVNSITETGSLTGNGNNAITFDRITGSVTLVGNTTTGTFDVVTNDQFTGTATTMLSVTNDGGALIQNNSFVGGTDGQTAIAILDTATISLATIVIANNTITLPGTTLSTLGISVTTGALTASLRITDNTVGTGLGKGLVIGAGNDANTQIVVQGNDFNNNAIGVEYAGAGGTTIATDLGGGTQGSLGNNNFRGFANAASATNAAIFVHGTAATALLRARNNAFGVTNPATVVQTSANIDTTNPLTTTQGFVQSLYHDLLGREGSASDLTFWTNVFTANGQAAVVTGIMNSTEGQNHLINSLYLRYLNRPADTIGLSFWSAVLASGGLEAVTAGILSSQEFLSRSSANPITAYYLALLNRTPRTDELAFWLPVLFSQGPNAVVLRMVASQEFRSDFAQSVFVTALHRQGTALEVSTLVNNTALSLLQIEASIYELPEFLTKG